MKDIYVIEESNGKTYWNKVGVCFNTNKDGSTNFALHMFPGVRFQMRESKYNNKIKLDNSNGNFENTLNEAFDNS